jgi:predicted transposase YdaD
VHRIYLDELGDVNSLPVTVAATVLTITDAEEAPELARSLLARTEQEASSELERANLIDIVTSIMVYKFTNLSRSEVRAMLGLDFSQEPQAIREAKEEGREEQTIALITRLLNRRLGHPVSEEIRSRLTTLPLPVLEDLSEALLDFSTIADLETWLTEHIQSYRS